MQVKRTSLSKINGLDEVDTLALRCQPSPSRENLQDQKAQKEASAKTDNLDINLDFSHEKPKMLIGDKFYDLPTLSYEKPKLPLPDYAKR
jgi:hypothetical protein